MHIPIGRNIMQACPIAISQLTTIRRPLYDVDIATFQVADQHAACIDRPYLPHGTCIKDVEDVRAAICHPIGQVCDKKCRRNPNLYSRWHINQIDLRWFKLSFDPSQHVTRTELRRQVVGMVKMTMTKIEAMARTRTNNEGVSG